MAAEPRIEIWPWIVAGLLALGIGTSVAFYAVARAHPDPEVDAAARRAELVTPAGDPGG